MNCLRAATTAEIIYVTWATNMRPTAVWNTIPLTMPFIRYSTVVNVGDLPYKDTMLSNIE